MNDKSTGTDTGWLSAQDAYATELAWRRENAKLTLAELATQCTYDTSYLFRLEAGERLGSADTAKALDRVYGTGASLLNLWRLAKQEAKARPFPVHTGTQGVTRIQEYAPTTLPAALQTPAYADEQPTPTRPGTLQQAIDRTRDRLNEGQPPGTTPIHYRALLDESVLHRTTRDPKVWTEQLEHLIHAAQQPDTALHIVPFGTGTHRIRSPLQLFFFPTAPTIAYAESGYDGHLLHEGEDIEHLHRAYDHTRDTALTPTAALDLLHTTLNNHTA